MSDTPNSRKLDETQMDQLLGAFYKTEMPAALDSLPSSWPELLQQSTKTSAQPTVVIASQTVVARGESTSAGRAFAVIASLTACVMLVVLSNLGGGSVSDPAANTIQVSGEGTSASGVVDPDVNTTMEEVDGFDFAPTESGNDSKIDSEPKPKTELKK